MRAVFFSGITCLLICVSQLSAQDSFFGTQGTYTVDTDALTFSGPNGFVFNGTDDNGVASYVFDDFLLLPTANIVTTGSRPAALISNSDLQVIGTITAESGSSTLGEGQNGIDQGGGGGGHGGLGGSGHDNFGAPGTPGGVTYGDLTSALFGGSAGGGATGFFGTSTGGLGGGAIRLQAAGELQLFGNISADGGTGGNVGFGGGGGSGGSIILSAPEIILAALISADGGTGGVGTFDNGGGGGGGRILIETLENGFDNFGTISAAGGSGGSSFFGSGSSGGDGVVSFQTIAVPEPSGALLILFGAVAGSCLRRKRLG